MAGVIVCHGSSSVRERVVAAAHGIPARGWDRDHYDVPADFYDAMVAAGAVPVTSRELVSALRAAGLRRPKAQSTG